ncbi:hypothetical protein ACNOYE_05970 [Nannocystaceae bacterium ST9]
MAMMAMMAMMIAVMMTVIAVMMTVIAVMMAVAVPAMASAMAVPATVMALRRAELVDRLAITTGGQEQCEGHRRCRTCDHDCNLPRGCVVASSRGFTQ